MSLPTALDNVLTKLEHAAEGVAEKVSGAVSADIAAISQDELDQLVARLEGVAERLVGLTPTAPPASASATADTQTGNAAATANTVPTWTPSNPAA